MAPLKFWPTTVVPTEPPGGNDSGAATVSKLTCTCAELPFASEAWICQLYVVLPFRLGTEGWLPELVGSGPQVIEVIELEKPFKLVLLAGICQIVPFELQHSQN